MRYSWEIRNVGLDVSFDSMWNGKEYEIKQGKLMQGRTKLPLEFRWG
jgi:hypothetical protein